ncbi:MAG TPA: molybdopterin molybdotransferase MoeA, partial [Pseudomonadales bacterium]
PAGSDTVVIQENADANGNEVTFREPCKPGANVRRQGHDVEKGSVLLSAGHRIRPADIGLLACVGVSDVTVRKPLRVAVIATGNELTPVGETLTAGSLYDSNGPMLTALLAQLGMKVIDGGRVGDDLPSTRTRLRELAGRADVLLTTGGVSVGEEDHVKAAIEAEGELNLWKVRIKPGKPLGFGRIVNTPWFGLPGNPVSAFVTFQLFVRPWLLKSQGASELHLKRVTLAAGFEWPKAGARQEYLRGRIEAGVVQLHLRQGSDALSGISWADCLVELPAGQMVKIGDKVTVLLV